MKNLTKANQYFRNGLYQEAKDLYIKISDENPALSKILAVNIAICSKNLSFINKNLVDKVLSFEQTTKESNASVEEINYGTILHNPLISIFIISFNSSSDLTVLFESICDQDYKNYEIIFIENGIEETEDLCFKYFKNYRYLKCNNVGFAEANNIALSLSKGELILLLNPDTRVEKNTIVNLLNVFRRDSSIAIAAPKILFYEKFINLKISSSSKFSINLEDFNKKSIYKKIIPRKGNFISHDFHSNENHEIELDVPHLNQGPVKFSIADAKNGQVILAKLGYEEQILTIRNETKSMELNFDPMNYSFARWIINNAGSGINHDGNPYDRAFCDYEDSDVYDTSVYLSAFCGAAALIRRLSIIERNIFSKVFFAYYEDSELSRWITKQGSKIIYVPKSIVYHKHSESTTEHSDVWNALTKRSFLIYKSLAMDGEIHPDSIEEKYEKLKDGPLKDRLIEYDIIFNASKGDKSSLFKKETKRLCIYNSYFNTYGGAELHCLSFVDLLKDNYEIYLASESDFDIKKLEEYFSLDLSMCIKIVCNNINTKFTSKFNCFINSTYCSNLESAADNNLFLTSFPSKTINKSTLQNYHFMHNSVFTKNWADNYWGSHSSSIVYPIIRSKVDDTIYVKEKIILSVGRFNRDGHNKNQHLILNAFKKAIDENTISNDWKLIFVGGVNLVEPSSYEYFKDIKNNSSGYNVEVLSNLPKSVLVEIYSKAAIYIHATGLDKPSMNPELHEHFGISVFDALCYGCIPVAYCIGGPAEQLEGIPQSSILFNNYDDLVDAIGRAVDIFECNLGVDIDIKKYAEEFISANTNNLHYSLKRILN